VDREFRTLASREHRGCFGKSSGGYGSIIHGMRYPATWGAIADHSGDAYFDFVYWHDWPNTLNELAKYRARPRKEGPLDVMKAQKGATPGATTAACAASSIPCGRSPSSRWARGTAS
jgi:enterochelin esterase-like enzyme